MSRIGKKAIEIPKAVKLAFNNGVVNVEGPKGKLNFKVSDRLKTNLKDGVISFDPIGDAKSGSSIQGTTRTVVSNMIKGVTEGFVEELLIEGVGFKSALQGKQLNLSLGFTHPVLFDIPEGLVVEVPKPTQIFVKGVDKVLVGYFAAKIRKVYQAEPYKGKGVRYQGEVVRRKAGKTVTK